MKSIKEKQILVKWAKAMNEPIDPALAEEVDRYNQLQQEIKESIRSNTINDLFDASKVAVDIIKKVNIEYPKPPTFEELLGIIKEESNELVQAQATETPTAIEEASTSDTPRTEADEPTDLISRAVNHIHKEVKLEENSFQQPQPTPAEKNFDAVQKKLKFLEQAVGKIAAHGPGSGSYWLYDLGDTNYDIIKHPSNNDILTYNSANTKWEVNNVTNLLGTRYHGSYYDMTTQTANVNSTPYFVRIGTVDFQSGFTTDGANIIATYAGVYNLQFSFQLHYTGGGGSGDHVEIWLSKNGIDQANTNTIVHVSSNNPYAVAAWNFMVPMDTGDKVALRWGSLNPNIKLESNGHLIGPAVPSVIATITTV